MQRSTTCWSLREPEKETDCEQAESLDQSIDFLKNRFDTVGVPWTRSKKDEDRFASLVREDQLQSTSMQMEGAKKPDGLRERLQEVNRKFDAGKYVEVRPELEKLLQDIKASKGAATTSVPSIKTRLSLCDLYLAGRAFSSTGNFEGACAEHYESSKRLVMEAMTEVQERAAWAALAQTHAERIESLSQARENLNALLSHYALPMQLSQLVKIHSILDYEPLSPKTLARDPGTSRNQTKAPIDRGHI